MIAYIDPTPIPGVSAPALQIAQTFNALADLRREVVLVTPAGEQRANSLGVPRGHAALHVPGARRRWFWPFASRQPFLWSACLWVARHRPRLLYVRNLRTADLLARRFPSIPFVFEAHEVFWRSRAFSHAHDRRGAGASLAAFKAMEQRVYNRAAGVVAITGALAEDLRADFGYLGPMLVSPDGVDIRAARAACKEGNPVADELLYLGSGAAWKGIDTAVRAMSYLDRAHLRIVGPSEDAARKLSRLAAELGVTNRVRVEPFVSPARRFDVIVRAAVCLLPGSRAPIAERFTSPLKLFEYLACARPVVAGNVPAVREILTHGDTGWLTEVGNPKDLAAGVSRLLADEPLRHRLGLAGAELANRFDWRVRAEGLARFLGASLRPAQNPDTRRTASGLPTVARVLGRVAAIVKK